MMLNILYTFCIKNLFSFAFSWVLQIPSLISSCLQAQNSTISCSSSAELPSNGKVKDVSHKGLLEVHGHEAEEETTYKRIRKESITQ